MARLRAPDGCPWDREQTLETLRPFLIEEAYEILEAIEDGNPAGHCEELGDLMFQIVFQSQVAAERGEFDLAEVIDRVARKILRRHPHVFGKESARTAAEVVNTWERVKQQEKAETGQKRSSVLDGLPTALPALLLAHRLSERASRVGFDWRNASEVLPKVREEFDEVAQALATRDESGRQKAIAWELGDLLFALTNFSRHLGFCAEELLREANRRFSRRFRIVERLAGERGIDMKSASIEALDALWDEAKAILGNS